MARLISNADRGNFDRLAFSQLRLLCFCARRRTRRMIFSRGTTPSIQRPSILQNEIKLRQHANWLGCIKIIAGEVDFKGNAKLEGHCTGKGAKNNDITSRLRGISARSKPSRLGRRDDRDYLAAYWNPVRLELSAVSEIIGT